MNRDQKLILAGVIVFVVVLIGAQTTYIVPPGHRGVLVTLGKVSPDFKPEGLGFKAPFISSIRLINIRLQTVKKETTCISEDLQEIKLTFNVLYRIPEESVVEIFQKYKGNPFESLVFPRVDESLKEVTKERQAKMTVQNRREVKTSALGNAQDKVGDLLHIVDLALENIFLSNKMEDAIEQKMVQEQNANKAVFEQNKAKIDAETAIIEARGEAESIRIRGEALAENPAFIDLQIVSTWSGTIPQVVSGNRTGPELFLPISKQLPKEEESE